MVVCILSCVDLGEVSHQQLIQKQISEEMTASKLCLNPTQPSPPPKSTIPSFPLIANFYLYATRGNNENQMRGKESWSRAFWWWMLRRRMTVYRACCSSTAGGSGDALAKKRTAPVGCVGWRFLCDSLGSHVHRKGKKKPQQRCKEGPAKADNSK